MFEQGPIWSEFNLNNSEPVARSSSLQVDAYKLQDVDPSYIAISLAFIESTLGAGPAHRVGTMIDRLAAPPNLNGLQAFTRNTDRI